MKLYVKCRTNEWGHMTFTGYILPLHNPAFGKRQPSLCCWNMMSWTVALDPNFLSSRTFLAANNSWHLCSIISQGAISLFHWDLFRSEVGISLCFKKGSLERRIGLSGHVSIGYNSPSPCVFFCTQADKGQRWCTSCCWQRVILAHRVPSLDLHSPYFAASYRLWLATEVIKQKQWS